jgi:aspartate oxidase
MQWDVLVVGGGIAGLNAALAASKNGETRVAIVCNRPVGDGGCISKVHGINAGFTGAEREAHFNETVASSKGLGDERLINVLTNGVADRIYELEELGMQFARDGETYALGRYGGCDQPRALNCLDFTGRELANVLGRAVIEAGCWVLDGLELVSLMMADDECVGVVCFDVRGNCLVPQFARSVVLACGGGLSSLRPSTNPLEKALGGISAAARAGAEIIDLELTQFHPTGLWLGSATTSGEIIEEELRTQGGKLINVDGARFAYEYTPLGEMATRDVVARAIALEVGRGRGVEGSYVWLDIEDIDARYLARRFPYTTKRLRAHGHDLLTTKRLPVYPASHFCLGGIRITTDCETQIPYLFACGEDAGGLHGANRLGGNGVAESLVFGHRAGIAAARNTSRILPTTAECGPRPVAFTGERFADADIFRQGAAVGTLRNGDALSQAGRGVEDMLASITYTVGERLGPNDTLYLHDGSCVEPWIRLQGLRLLISAAEARRECLGPHYRTDYENAAGDSYVHTITHTDATTCESVWLDEHDVAA